MKLKEDTFYVQIKVRRNFNNYSCQPYNIVLTYNLDKRSKYLLRIDKNLIIRSKLERKLQQKITKLVSR